MERALAAIEVFAHFCARHRARRRRVDAVATSAIRDAANSAELPRRGRASDGPADPRALARGGGALRLPGGGQLHDAGRRRGARPRRRLACSSCGSRPRATRARGSWPLGAVRMTERFLPGKGPAKRKQLDALRDARRARARAAPWLAGVRAAHLVGIGGTVRNLAAAAQRRAGLPELRRAGLRASQREALDDLVAELAALPVAERGSVPGIKPARGGPHPRRRRGRAGACWRRAASTRSRRPRPGCARASSSSACSARPATRRCSTTCAARAC